MSKRSWYFRNTVISRDFKILSFKEIIKLQGANNEQITSSMGYILGYSPDAMWQQKVITVKNCLT